VKELLIEIGCEEIPAFVQEGLGKYLHDFLVQRLRELNFEVEEGKHFATPTRVASLVRVEPYSKEVFVERKGPPLKVAYDEKGNPTPSLLSFLKSLNANLEDTLIIKEGEKEYVGVRLKRGGEFVGEHVGNIVLEFINAAPLPKRMRWDNSGLTFIRPIRWILCLLEDEVIKFKVGNIESSNFTYTPRVPERRKIYLERAGDYEKVLEENGIIPNFEKRKERIKEETEKFFKISPEVFENFNVDVEYLIYEIAGLVEKGYAIYGRFDEKFLKELYPEVITTAMVTHQRYIPHIENGDLKAGFVVFSNNPKGLERQVRGFENVLRARLDDALFYKTEDLKKSPDHFVENLKGITWLKGVGSLYDKVERVEVVSSRISELVGMEASKVTKVARYYLFDISTSMIGEGKEFTKLEGKIGYYYWREIYGEEDFARAIYDSHLPKGRDFPKTKEGHIVALADSLVQIKGLLDMGYKWTSSRDPLGIRASARRFVSLLLYDNENFVLGKIPFSEFLNLISPHSAIFLSLIEDILPSALEFLQNRFNYPYYPKSGDFAVLTFRAKNLLLEMVKARVLEDLVSERFITITKRVKNILESKPGRFLDDSGNEYYEKKLEEYLLHLEGKLKRAKETEKVIWNLEGEKVFEVWMGYGKELLGLYEVLDEFFANVPVMVSDEKKRERRLNLIRRAYDFISEIIREDKMGEITTLLSPPPSPQ
jgi:glycyl-tRNA synthetase beta chain